MKCKTADAVAYYSEKDEEQAFIAKGKRDNPDNRHNPRIPFQPHSHIHSPLPRLFFTSSAGCRLR
jgi:hypothetical protein